MKKTIIFAYLLLFIFVFTTSSFAESNASVSVENTVNSNNEENTNNKTNIRIETNGKVTEYESQEPNQKIEVKASNDESTIKVDGEIVSETATSEGNITPKKSAEEKMEEKPSEDDSNMFVRLFKQLLSFLDLL